MTAQLKKYFPGRLRATNPEVVVTGINRIGNITYAEQTVSGRFWRVSPTTAHEVAALQMMENQFDKFPPASGNGIIVSAEAMAKLDAKPNF